MQLTKIKLRNFRQYINETIEFSTNPEKNVTLIIGDGGAGKTTLSQAFTWVLYEKTDFSNPILLNSKVAQDMGKGAVKIVQVVLYLNYGEKKYIIDRKAKYIRNNAGNIKQDGNSTISMFEVVNGNQNRLSDLERHSIVREIMPEELSRYFFFDGEKIEKMSKEIERGKSEEFSNAVQGLLGLTALKNIKKHFDPTKTGSVYGFYDKKIEEKSDREAAELSVKIQQDVAKLESVKKEIEELENKKQECQEKIVKISNQLEQYRESEELQKKHRKLECDLKEAHDKRRVKTKSFLDNLHSASMIDYCSKTLMLKALEELKADKKIDKGIPDIQGRTIDYLVKKKKCLCGRCIEADSEEYRTLIELKEYIPPKSVGGAITDLANTLETKVQSSKNFFNNMKSYMTDIRSAEQSINDINNNLALIDMNLENSTQEKVRELKLRQNSLKTLINQCQHKIDDDNIEQGRLEGSIETKRKKRETLLLKSNDNEKYSLLRAYAQSVYDKVCDSYDKEEMEMREKFQEVINEMYIDIYGQGITMEIDSNYNISVQVDEAEEADDTLDHSTSQNYSVIFAFIATIMKMNKEKKNVVEEEKAESEESYPLVMDAPLSAFDKSRIANLCHVLPGLAEQIIMFIKDTDGDIAREHMKEMIGKSYRINMDGLLNSRIAPEVF